MLLIMYKEITVYIIFQIVPIRILLVKLLLIESPSSQSPPTPSLNKKQENLNIYLIRFIQGKGFQVFL